MEEIIITDGKITKDNADLLQYNMIANPDMELTEDNNPNLVYDELNFFNSALNPDFFEEGDRTVVNAINTSFAAADSATAINKSIADSFNGTVGDTSKSSIKQIFNNLKTDTGKNNLIEIVDYISKNAGTKVEASTLTEGETSTPLLVLKIGDNKYTVPYDTHKTSMPTPTADLVGKIYQYVGPTDTNYTQGFYYIVVADTVEEGQTQTYSYKQINTQPSSEAKISTDAGNIITKGTDDGLLATIPENIKAVEANPTLVGTETALSSIKIGETNYKLANEVSISEVEGNIIEKKDDGLYAKNESISSAEGNIIEKKNDGLYAKNELSYDTDNDKMVYDNEGDDVEVALGNIDIAEGIGYDDKMITETSSREYANLATYKYMVQNGDVTNKDLPDEYDLVCKVTNNKYRSPTQTELTEIYSNINSYSVTDSVEKYVLRNGNAIYVGLGTYHYATWCGWDGGSQTAPTQIITRTYYIASSTGYPYVYSLQTYGGAPNSPMSSSYSYPSNDGACYLPVCEKTGAYETTPPEGFIDAGISVWVSESTLKSTQQKSCGLITVAHDFEHISSDISSISYSKNNLTTELALKAEMTEVSNSLTGSIASVKTIANNAQTTASTANTNASTAKKYASNNTSNFAKDRGDTVIFTNKNTTVTTSNKSTYSSSSYSFYNAATGSNRKYYDDALTSLRPEDDVATFALGPNYRLPTPAELTALNNRAKNVADGYVTYIDNTSGESLKIKLSSGYKNSTSTSDTSYTYLLTSTKPATTNTCNTVRISSDGTLSSNNSAKYVYCGYQVLAVSDTRQEDTVKLGNLYYRKMLLGASDNTTYGVYYSYGDTSNVTKRYAEEDTVYVFSNTNKKTYELATAAAVDNIINEVIDFDAMLGE